MNRPKIRELIALGAAALFGAAFTREFIDVILYPESYGSFVKIGAFGIEALILFLLAYLITEIFYGRTKN